MWMVVQASLPMFQPVFKLAGVGIAIGLFKLPLSMHLAVLHIS